MITFDFLFTFIITIYRTIRTCSTLRSNSYSMTEMISDGTILKIVQRYLRRIQGEEKRTSPWQEMG